MHIVFERDGNVERLHQMIRTLSAKNLRRLRYFAVIFILLGAVLVALGSKSGLNTVLGAVLVALGFFYLLLPLVAVRRQTRRLAPLFAETATYTITDVDMTIHSEPSTHIFRWSAFSNVVETGGFWICKQAGITAAVIPQDCMQPADIAALRAFLAGRSLVPTEYRVG